MNREVVLITGGATGIGKACVFEFVKKNYDVIFTYNNSKEEALKLVDEIKNNYDINIYSFKCDITNEEEIKQLINDSISMLKKIDILVNNAGICIDSLYDNKTKDNFMKTLETNLVGTFLISKYVGDIMYRNKYGKIINISSTNGIDKYYPMCLDYDASKSGLISLTHNLSLQYSPYVCVNAVAPGWIGTENELKDVDEDYLKTEEEKIFIKRIGRPDEVAYLISFLASHQADYINNEVIRIDGGTY